MIRNVYRSSCKVPLYRSSCKVPLYRSSCKVPLYRSSCNVPLFVSDFNKTWIFSKYFRKPLKYQISSQSVQLFHTSIQTDGRTDMTKLTIAFLPPPPPPPLYEHNETTAVQELHADEFEFMTTYPQHSPRLFLPSAPFVPSSPSLFFTTAFLTSPFHFSVLSLIPHPSPPSALPHHYSKTVDSH